MSSTSGKYMASISTIPKELVFRIIQKMNGSALLDMYKTCSWMSEVIERQLEDLDPRNLTLGKAQTLYLNADVVNVKFERTINLNRKLNKRKPTRVFNISYSKLPVDTLDSNIWSFTSFKEIHLKDKEIAARYLNKIQFEIPGIKTLKVANCDFSVVAKALQLFKPTSVEIESFIGDVKQILPHLPFEKWIEHGGGLAKFPQRLFIHDLPDPGHPFVPLLQLTEGNDRHFLLTFPEKKSFVFSMMETRIRLVPLSAVTN